MNFQVAILYRDLPIIFCQSHFALSSSNSQSTETLRRTHISKKKSDITVNLVNKAFSKNKPFYEPLKHSIPLLLETESRFRVHVLDEHSANNRS